LGHLVIWRPNATARDRKAEDHRRDFVNFDHQFLGLFQVSGIILGKVAQDGYALGGDGDRSDVSSHRLQS
jgi:hypothetical protein